MQFSLRTIFIIITTVAIYTAVNVALLQWSNTPVAASLGVYAVATLPLFLLWVVAAFWVYEHRATLVGYRLVFYALLLNIGWRLASQLITAFAYRLIPTSSSSVSLIFTLNMFLDSAVKTASWAMLLYAFIQANRARQEAAATAASPWLPDEPSTT